VSVSTERWKRGEASVAQVHFASGVLFGRLLGLARGWSLGLGPVAVLACLPGEQHDLGLIAFGLALRSQGWRIVYLGADSPVDTVADVSRQLEPSLVVLNAVSRERVRPVLSKLRALARRHTVALGGAAAEDRMLEKDGILALTGDPTAEAARITTLIHPATTPRSEAWPRCSPRQLPGRASRMTTRGRDSNLGRPKADNGFRERAETFTIPDGSMNPSRRSRASSPIVLVLAEHQLARVSFPTPSRATSTLAWTTAVSSQAGACRGPGETLAIARVR
jgi:hypothetical protein